MSLIQPVVEQAADGSPSGDGDGEGGAGEEEIDPMVYQYVPPEPKEWISLGSEQEIEDSSWGETEKKVSHKTSLI